MLLAAWLVADTTLAGCKAGEEGRLRHRGGGSFGQAKRRAQANTKAFARYLYNLTSIIMDQVRRFMKFAIVEVVNYAAAI